MAQELVTILWDDFDRSQRGDETLRFSFEGVDYVIDLTTDNAEEFRQIMAPYVEAAREDVPLTKSKAKSKSKGEPVSRPVAAQAGVKSVDETKADRDAMRRWARNNGFEIGHNGQISREIRAAYQARNAVDALVGASK